MPYSRKQERFLHANKIQHKHDYNKISIGDKVKTSLGIGKVGYINNKHGEPMIRVRYAEGQYKYSSLKNVKKIRG